MLSIQNNKNVDCNYSISVYSRKGFLYVEIEPEDEKASDRHVLKFTPHEAHDFIHLIRDHLSDLINT